MTSEVLIVHHERKEFTGRLCSILDGSKKAGYRLLNCDKAADPERILKRALSREEYGTVVFSVEPGVAESSSKLLKLVSGWKPKKPRIVCVGDIDPEELRDFFEIGVDEFLVPPISDEELANCVLDPARSTPAREDRIRRSIERIALRRIIGENPAFIDEINKIPIIAKCNACVLITGETGTGKEIIARTIHYLSTRPDKPFVPVNCGAIPNDLIENELFGHARGAYTGATEPHTGLVGEALKGTLFLDEVDSLPLIAQVKLLRFLQDKEFRRLGSVTTQKADVRIIAASNNDLEGLMRDGKIRSDLYYRLNVLQVALPPLRERLEDVRALALHFLDKYSEEFGKDVDSIGPDALLLLKNNKWYGNVRELENVIERAVLMCSSNTLTAADIQIVGSTRQKRQESLSSAKSRVVADFEQAYIKNALEAYNGNITHAARAAGKDRRVFFQLIRKYRINVDNFRH